MLNALWVDCPGLREGKYYHSMRDGCFSCAPWWERIPLCPTCKRKLMKKGKTKCKTCNRFVIVGEDVEEQERMREFRERHERLLEMEKE
jgi:hypothetical protein